MSKAWSDYFRGECGDEILNALHRRFGVRRRFRSSEIDLKDDGDEVGLALWEAGCRTPREVGVALAALSERKTGQLRLRVGRTSGSRRWWIEPKPRTAKRRIPEALADLM